MNLLEFISSYCTKQIQYSSKTIVLREGDKANYIYFVIKGCLRMWLNNNGTDVTTQFFFEGNAVASLESLLKNEKSNYNLETVEPCTLLAMSKKDFLYYRETDESFRGWINGIIQERFFHYSKHIAGFLRTKPLERYEKLLNDHPEIFQRIPQQHIASYLGITPISLSRIRNRR